MSYKEEFEKFVSDKGFWGGLEPNSDQWTNLSADFAEKKVKESNLLDQKIDEEGNVLEKPNIHSLDYVESIALNNEWNDTPTLRQEREELKRLKEDDERWERLYLKMKKGYSVKRKRLIKANKKIEELKDGINQAMSKDYSSRVDLVNDINKIFESLNK